MAANPQFESTQARTGDRIERREGELALPNPFALESGQDLHSGRLAWQCVGPEHAPLVIVLGGISAHRRCCAQDDRGWWQSQCGTDRALDTQRYRLLGVDWLGGVDGSSGPRGDADFPDIAASDQARALLLLLNRLGVRQVHLIVGASYGGAVAQHLAALLGERLRCLVLLSAAHRPSQFAVALRHVQRSILELGGDAQAALALARSLAVLSYRTPEGVEARFTDANAGGATTGDVVGWLAHHGERFAQRFDAAAYRCLGASLDGHVIDPASVRAPTVVLGVREDLLVPVSLLREYAARAGAKCRLVEVSSIYGHDAFLKEEAVVGALLREALETAA